MIWVPAGSEFLIQLWHEGALRDPADGKDYVVNGHHRHELAKRTGHPDMAVRWIAAKDAREARADTAIVLHLAHPELWPELLSFIRSVPKRPA